MDMDASVDLDTREYIKEGLYSLTLKPVFDL